MKLCQAKNYSAADNFSAGDFFTRITAGLSGEIIIRGMYDYDLSYNITDFETVCGKLHICFAAVCEKGRKIAFMHGMRFVCGIKVPQSVLKFVGAVTAAIRAAVYVKTVYIRFGRVKP